MTKLEEKKVVIRKRYLKLLSDYKQAIVLDTLIKYSKKNFKRHEYNNFILEEQLREEGVKNINEVKHGWFNLTMNCLCRQVMITKTNKTVRRWLKPIIKKNYILRGKDFNRAAYINIFRINAVKLKKDLNKIGYHIKNFQFKIGV